MSDPTPPAEKPEAAVVATKKGGPALPILLGIVVVALAAGVALGTLVLGPSLARSKTVATAATTPKDGKPDDHAKDGKGKNKDEKTSVFRIENVIVNPAGSEGAHFLMATVAISLADSKQEETLKAHEDELRDRVISVLEKQTLASLSAPGARDTLRGRIATALAPIVGSADPARVFLPQFVIQ